MDSELRTEVAEVIGFLLGTKGKDIIQDSIAGQSVAEIMQLIAASNKALLLRVREGLPISMSEYFDDAGMEKFSGWNDYRKQALAVIDAEMEGNGIPTP